MTECKGCHGTGKCSKCNGDDGDDRITGKYICSKRGGTAASSPSSGRPKQAANPRSRNLDRYSSYTPNAPTSRAWRLNLQYGSGRELIRLPQRLLKGWTRRA